MGLVSAKYSTRPYVRRATYFILLPHSRVIRGFVQIDAFYSQKKETFDSFCL